MVRSAALKLRAAAAPPALLTTTTPCCLVLTFLFNKKNAVTDAHAYYDSTNKSELSLATIYYLIITARQYTHAQQYHVRSYQPPKCILTTPFTVSAPINQTII